MLTCTYNEILKGDPETPIIYVSFEDGLDEFSAVTNAFPEKTLRYKAKPTDEVIAFEHAYRMMGHQLRSNVNFFTKKPVLLIDSITGIPDKVFDKFATFLKKLVDDRLMVVIILASNGESKDKILASEALGKRKKGKYEIVNDFTVEQVKDVLKHSTAYSNIYDSDKAAFELLSQTMHRVTGGRIGYVQLLCVEPFEVSGATMIKKVIENRDKQDEVSKILPHLEQIMLECLFEEYVDKIIDAFKTLKKCNIDKIIKLIDVDLPDKVKGYGLKVLETLIFYNIIEVNLEKGTITFESEPLRRIFSDAELLQRMRNKLT